MADTQMGLRHARVRQYTGTAQTYEGDWHALFTMYGIPAGPFDGRMLAWLNIRMNTTFSTLSGAKQAFAEFNGAYNWQSMGDFEMPERSQVITASSSWVVPAGVYKVLATLVAGGGGGGGGHATGGAGGGGGAGMTILNWPVAVTPGSTLTLVVGGKGAGGTAGNGGVDGGPTTLAGGAAGSLYAAGGDGGGAGAATNGGSGGRSALSVNGWVQGASAAGGAAAGAAGGLPVGIGNIFSGSTGGAGAGTGSGGGGESRSMTGVNPTGGANIGGGAGGCSCYGNGGNGSTGAAGVAAAATAYGAGGGGGGVNFAGGDAADGVVILEWTQ